MSSAPTSEGTSREEVDLSKLHPSLVALRAQFPELLDEVRHSDWIEFWENRDSEAVYVRANVDQLTDRVRVRLFLPYDEESLVRDWVESQPQPASGVLQYIEEDGNTFPRLVFMRPATTLDWTSDPLFDDLEHFRAAWLDDLALGDYTSGRFVPYDDPRDLVPESAWLLKGSEASYPKPDEVERGRNNDERGVYEQLWTASSQTKPGDLALLYFVTPRKSVCFVARAASRAFFSKELEVNSDNEVHDAQWWAYFTTPVEIEPVGFSELAAAADGHIVLRGRSGQYLRPEVIERLDMRPRAQVDRRLFERVLVLPAGDPELPPPDVFELESWRDVAAAAFKREADVTRHAVLPLLERLMPTGWLLQEQFPAGPKVGFPDVVLVADEPRYVVEVKKVIRSSEGGRWRDSPDFRQLRRYQEALGLPGMLIDVHRMLLVDVSGEIVEEIERSTANADALELVRSHIASAVS